MEIKWAKRSFPIGISGFCHTLYVPKLWPYFIKIGLLHYHGYVFYFQDVRSQILTATGLLILVSIHLVICGDLGRSFRAHISGKCPCSPSCLPLPVPRVRGRLGGKKVPWVILYYTYGCFLSLLYN